MKASELRIGNWIEWQDDSHEQFQVETIDYREPNYFVNGGLFDDMLPIPLTEEWLIMFGFELKRIDPGDTFESYHLPLKRTGWYLANVITYGSVTLFNNHDHTSTGVGAEYVHQLQNLYFALTGEELTVKESWPSTK